MFSEGFLLKGVAAPAVLACVATLVFRRVLTGTRGASCLGFALGQAVGTSWMLAGGDDWLPGRNLQWVPWFAVGAALIGPSIIASGLSRVERWLLTVAMALAAAAFLVPTWADLWPVRWISMTAFVASVSILARGTSGVAQRTSPRLVAATFAGTALVAALLIAACLSLSIGEAALTTAAAFAGTALAMLFLPDDQAVRGLSLPFAIAVGGWCYVAAIEPRPALPALLFVPLAPLLLWCTALGPASRWNVRPRIAVSLLLVTAWLVGIGAWAWFSTEQEEDEYFQSLKEAPAIFETTHTSRT